METDYYLRQPDELNWNEALILAMERIEGAEWVVNSTTWTDTTTGEPTTAGADKPASPNSIARNALLTALTNRELNAFAYTADGKRASVPFDYWMRFAGPISIGTGTLLVSPNHDEKPFFVLESELITWLDGLDQSDPAPEAGPEPNADKGRRYLSVRSKARELYPDPSQRPSYRAMALKVAGGQSGSFEGLGWETIKKIIEGRYEPATALGIDGLASLDP